MAVDWARCEVARIQVEALGKWEEMERERLRYGTFTRWT